MKGIYIPVEKRKKAIMKAYNDTESWVLQVNKMPIVQICAIFDNLVRQGRIVVHENGNLSYKTLDDLRKERKLKNEVKCGHQMTLDEWLKEKENLNEQV